MGSVCGSKTKKKYSEQEETKSNQPQRETVQTRPQSVSVKKDHQQLISEPKVPQQNGPVVTQSNQPTEKSRKGSIDQGPSKQSDEKTSPPKNESNLNQDLKARGATKPSNYKGVSEEGNPNLLIGLSINGPIKSIGSAGAGPKKKPQASLLFHSSCYKFLAMSIFFRICSIVPLQTATMHPNT